MKFTNGNSLQTTRLKNAIDKADAVVIGAGAGLSAAAGLMYSGERFMQNFAEFSNRYGFQDMYTASFYPFKTTEEYWAYMSRHIRLNRYADFDQRLYSDLLQLIKDKDYFVVTTNVDHCFQRAGFDKERLFYMQGDYGLWQCSVPCHNKTYVNQSMVLRMVNEQRNFKIPAELVPYCPKCGKPMAMNLRCDNTFVQDLGWYAASDKYAAFLKRIKSARAVYLELGVGYNTPSIIKIPFWQFTAQNEKAVFASINIGETYCPHEIEDRSICIDADIAAVIKDIKD